MGPLLVGAGLNIFRRSSLALTKLGVKTGIDLIGFTSTPELLGVGVLNRGLIRGTVSRGSDDQTREEEEDLHYYDLIPYVLNGVQMLFIYTSSASGFRGSRGARKSLIASPRRSGGGRFNS